ncbi:hypothetical protein LC1Hm_0545 [Halomicrobium sp. LC1Hm]|nr:hypothetical protein LC1Hm_0545 [Halomicrobium sp. LC1Hm]
MIRAVVYFGDDSGVALVGEIGENVVRRAAMAVWKRSAVAGRRETRDRSGLTRREAARSAPTAAPKR